MFAATDQRLIRKRGWWRDDECRFRAVAMSLPLRYRPTMAKKKQRPDPVSYLDDTPVPMTDFWMRSVDFHDAYNNLKEQRLIDWARYALIGHAVEVGLKSYLLAHGLKRKKLQKKFGHDLDALLAEAKDKGLAVTATVQADIGHLNHVHDNFLARYPEYEGLTTNDGKGIVAVEELAPSVEKLLTAIGTALASPAKKA